MRVLVSWGTKLGGTEGIARIIAEELASSAIGVDLRPAGKVRDLADYDAVIIGGALYANRWHRDARRFVLRNTKELRKLPVWFFSSGPLDDSAEGRSIPPTSQVRALMERVGALGHMTFGGRIPADATGFPAGAMAKEHAGDWRNPELIRDWARLVARELPTAVPGHYIEHPARSPWRLVGHGVAGWAACGAIMAGLLAITGTGVALAIHAIAVPLVFVVVSRHYFAPMGARQPLPVALAFVGIVATLDLIVVAGLFQGSLEMFKSGVGIWLPLALIFAATYITGIVMSTLPWPRSQDHAEQR